jgi:hypothetical protein
VLLIRRNLPHVADVKSEVLTAVGSIFRWSDWGKVTDYCLDRLFEIRGESKIVKIIFLQVGFHG